MPLCPKCGDPVITSGCYPDDGVCGADGRECTCAMSESSMVNCAVHGYDASDPDALPSGRAEPLHGSAYAAPGEPACGKPHPEGRGPCLLRPDHWDEYPYHARPVSGGFDTWGEPAPPDDPEAVRLLKYALHLRMHGECAPGGDETWAQFDREAEAYLRSLPEAAPLHEQDAENPLHPVAPGVPVEAGQTYLVSVAAGTVTPVSDRDYAGLGLPCGPCVGACRLDDEGPAS